MIIIALLSLVTLVIRSALQSQKWQLIGMSILIVQRSVRPSTVGPRCCQQTYTTFVACYSFLIPLTVGG